MTCSYNRGLNHRRGSPHLADLNVSQVSDCDESNFSPHPPNTSYPAAQQATGCSDIPAARAHGNSPVDWVNCVEGASELNMNHVHFDQELDSVTDYPWSFNMSTLPLLPPFGLEGAPDFMLENFNSPGIEAAAQRLSQPTLTSLSLEQLDPLFAKCAAIKALLQEPGPVVPEGVLTSSINRNNLLLALQLFSQNFQRHIPFLHVPTFDLATASPLLVLAMFIVGVCYTDIIRPANHIFSMAIQVLVHIERQQHEIDMTEPTLSSIQAGIAAFAVLGSSQDETAHRVIPLYCARIVSMARRAGILDMSPTVDHRTLTEQTFDWHLWVERETRTRIANTLFCQDMASCIFMGKAPAFAPLDLHIELPSYEICWNARSPQACLQHLQSMPPQRKLSSTLSQLRILSLSSQEQSPLEVSAFGMFTLLKALHCLVWQANHHDLDRQLDIGHCNFSSPPVLINLDQQLASDFSGANIIKLTAQAVRRRGSSTFTSINDVLDKWLTIWEQRTWHDIESENISFSLDPLPFWRLAKLFLLLHCGREHFSGSEFSSVNNTGGTLQDSRASQAKVFLWLARLRQKDSADRVQKVDSLASLMSPI
ncbi:c2h2 transcription factor [Penicillium atrosanguineum]|uniref:C2h2 transcription factor n=1 Tax=Penicillium atrosanguineum TaxID=1132637 RepID=A0A9W9GFI4_9EURO|nr:uncharacterized protein N7443_007131 [Penicillium atrosanguineum]KAJ5118201.1 c2h2 transcription factor [Penicillium atrosanguineum]KAJ5119246.1 c2h2 transcription factor [Penicillium atrosanguineum]KAJ5296238.1 hypothetical protein N7443_007131 [Penicillium atrosanguineum]KAJ5299009.1 c2h2 transcription factor [Penicillium atrosanguineum]